ncbi:MAG: S41 family peptidase [Patescibacteria group bacterium]
MPDNKNKITITPESYQSSHQPDDFLNTNLKQLSTWHRLKNHLSTRQNLYLKISYSAIILIIFVFGAIIGLGYATKLQQGNKIENHYIGFLLDIFDQIKGNFWDKISDEQLTNLYKLGSEKLTGRAQAIKNNNRRGLQNMLEDIIPALDQVKQKEFTTTLADIVLANLTPANRSRLYTTKKQQDLRNKVNSTDPATNLYNILGIEKITSSDEIKKVYEEKLTELQADPSPEAKDKLAAINRAYQTLGSNEARQIYDQSGVEPTIVPKIFEPDILYLKIKQISPSTVDEWQKVINQMNAQPNLTSLILDLRGNFGGAVDTIPYFMGFFIGSNQYAVDYFIKGESQPIKTKIGRLETLTRYKKMVVLIDNKTESSAEIWAAALKKYNIGVVMGETTAGRGTIENFFPIKTEIDPNETYSALIVRAVALRDDGQPIEGRGVEPTIKLSDATWPEQLMSYFNYPNLVEAVKQIVK